jgi:hypothetical protein
MSFDYESTNRALLSRYNLDDIIYVNTTPHLLRCLAEGKSIAEGNSSSSDLWLSGSDRRLDRHLGLSCGWWCDKRSRSFQSCQ